MTIINETAISRRIFPSEALGAHASSVLLASDALK
jgi:hypothetical protein